MVHFKCIIISHDIICSLHLFFFRCSLKYTSIFSCSHFSVYYHIGAFQMQGENKWREVKKKILRMQLAFIECLCPFALFFIHTSCNTRSIRCCWFFVHTISICVWVCVCLGMWRKRTDARCASRDHSQMQCMCLGNRKRGV